MTAVAMPAPPARPRAEARDVIAWIAAEVAPARAQRPAT